MQPWTNPFLILFLILPPIAVLYDWKGNGKYKMKQTAHTLQNGLEMVIREAMIEDASSVINYVHQVCAESDFLTFGPDKRNNRKHFEFFRRTTQSN